MPVLIHIYVTSMTVWRPVGGAVESTEIHNSWEGAELADSASCIGLGCPSWKTFSAAQTWRRKIIPPLSRPLLFYQNHTKRRAAPAKRKG